MHAGWGVKLLSREWDPRIKGRERTALPLYICVTLGNSVSLILSSVICDTRLMIAVYRVVVRLETVPRDPA